MKTLNAISINNPNNNSNLIHEAYGKLQDALQDINSNKSWLEYLTFQSKFYNYSFSNTLLIYCQNKNASFVAGYKKWQSLNRFVKKGEHGIKILAPMKYRLSDDDTEDNVYKLSGFRVVTVFDISQTDGSDEFLPVLVSGLKQSIKEESDIYKNLIEIIDIPVIEVDKLAAKGCYYSLNPRIEIHSSLTIVQKIKTFFHEFSHHLHHIKYFDNEKYELGEIIAESSAFIACNYIGIDTSDYSVGYIKSWANDINSMQVVATKIQKISSDIINLINESPSITTSAVLSNETF